MESQKLNAHHHGNLAQALINAGIEILNEGGLKALSLRKCAARAGVSHSAPAHHFDGLKGLTSAICQEGFQIFARSMQDQIDSAPNDPYERLVGMCEGYVLFFQNHQALANIMFNKEFNFHPEGSTGRNNNQAFQILINTCKPFKSNRMGDENLEFAVWSMIQGYSSLLQLGEIDPNGRTEGAKIELRNMLAMLNLQPT